jgi:hypothetical protein
MESGLTNQKQYPIRICIYFFASSGPDPVFDNTRKSVEKQNFSYFCTFKILSVKNCLIALLCTPSYIWLKFCTPTSNPWYLRCVRDKGYHKQLFSLKLKQAYCFIVTYTVKSGGVECEIWWNGRLCDSSPRPDPGHSTSSQCGQVRENQREERLRERKGR